MTAPATWPPANHGHVRQAVDSLLVSPPPHSHTAGEITSGVLPPARLGTGNVGAGQLVLHDDGTWKLPASGGSAAVYTRKNITANYAVILADATATILNTTAAIDPAGDLLITLPSNTTAAIAEEVPIQWRQSGTRRISFVAGVGATVNGLGGITRSAGQYAQGLITTIGPSIWIVSGELAA